MSEQEQERLNSLSVKELRKILQDRAVDFSDCVEKTDLVKRALETQHIKANTKKNISKRGGIIKWEEQLSGLNCIVVEPENCDKIDFVLILLHGYGAGNTDLVDLGELALRAKQIKMRCIFPAGILPVQGAGRCWWPLDMQELMMKVMSGDLSSVFEKSPPGLLEARKTIIKLIEDLKSELKLSNNHFILGGFSQGAMLSTDVSLHLEETPLGLVAFSGVYLAREEWAKQASKRKGMKVLQSHGTSDTLLPYPFGLELKQFFEKSEMEHEFVSFQGVHTIGEIAVKKFIEFVGKLTSK